MSKTDEELQKEEDQYYKDLIEQTDQIEKMELDVTDCTEEDLFNQILRDERDGERH
jgi:hypothetical protein